MLAVRITHSRLSAGDLASLFDSYAAPTLKSFVYQAAYPRMDSTTCCWVCKFISLHPFYWRSCYSHS